MNADPDPRNPLPPSPPSSHTPILRRIPVITAIIVAAAVLIALVVTRGDDPATPNASDTTTTVATTATTPGSGTEPVSTTSGTTPGETTPGGTAPGSTTTETVPGTEPRPPEPWVSGLTLAWDAGSERARATWLPAAGGDHFTYRFTWESADDAGDDFGTIPAGTLAYAHDVPCGASIAIQVLAWTAAGGELGRDEASTVSAECPPTVALPTNLQAHGVPTGVQFDWNAGVGYRTAFEVTIADAGGASTDIGNLDGVTSYRVDAFCGTAISFTLFALEDGGSAELGRLSAEFDTPPCPGTFAATSGNVVAAPGTGAVSLAPCPAGSAVVGGGFGAGINVAAMPYPGWIYRSEVDGNQWAAALGAPPERDLFIRASVLCMAHAETEVRSSTVSVPSDAVRSVVAECPAGPYWVAVGGGFMVDPYGPKILVNAPEGADAWRVTAFNENASPVSLRVTVVCISLPNAASQIVRSSVTISDGSWGSRELTCPAGWTMLGGGWATPDISVEFAGHTVSSGPTRWSVFGHNQQFSGPAGPAVQLEVMAVCVRFR